MKFDIQQIALFPPEPEAAIALLKEMGLTDWARDLVRASGEVNGVPESNSVGSLAFNYQALTEAKELEVLSYDHGRHWMEGKACGVSHIGMHCGETDLLEWRDFFAKRSIAVVQELYTEAHSNPDISGKRWYHYVIFNTRPILGVDFKFIIRKDSPPADPNQLECLVCGARHFSAAVNTEHAWCEVCKETTNHVIDKA